MHWISAYKILYGTDRTEDLRNHKTKLFKKYLFNYFLKRKKELIKARTAKKQVAKNKKILLLNTDNNLIKDWPKDFLQKAVFVDHSPSNKQVENLSFVYEKFLLVVAYLYPSRKIKTRLVTQVLSRIRKVIEPSGIEVIYCATNTLISNAFLFAGVQLKKHTIIAQHGIYQLHFEGTYPELKLCNHVIVWGNLLKKIYDCNPGIELTVLPTLKNFKKAASPTIKVNGISSILFIGTSDYKVEKDVLVYSQQFILKALKAATERKIKCIYRPHPREDISISLGAEIIQFIKNNTLISIDGKSNTGDWKVGFFSTYLVELHLQGEFVSQLIHPEAKRDVLNNWFNIDAIYSIGDFTAVLDKSPFEIDIRSSDDYLLVEENPGYKYYEYLENLMAKTNGN